jgi:hypothetical protein
MERDKLASMGGRDELIDLLRQTPVILRGLTAGLDDDSARARADDDAWSVVEVIGHLIDAERRASDRITQIQTEENPVLEGYDQMALVERNAYRSRTVSELLAAFEMVRAEWIAVLEALDAAGWERRSTFSTYGTGSLREITIHMCGHDANHLAQIAGRFGG